MRDLLIVFFIFSFLLLIIVFPFKTRVMAHFNLLDMKCYYSVKTWIIKLLCGRVLIENGRIDIQNEITLLSKTYQTEFVKKFGQKLIGEIDVKKMEIYFVGGFKENSFSSAILCGSVISIVESLFAYLSLKFDNVKLFKDIDPTFKEDNFEVTTDVVVSVSLWRLVKCFFMVEKELKECEN